MTKNFDAIYFTDYFRLLMVKASIKYLLILCILMLSVINQLTAFTHSGNTAFLPQKWLQDSRYIRPETGHHISITPFLIEKKENSLLYFEEDKVEDEDDHSIFQKKQLNNSNLFPILFYHWNYSLVLLNFPKVLFSYKHFISLTSNKLFVIFGVFRI